MINSRQKGKRAELEIAKIFRDYGFSDARRTAQFCGNTGDASDVVGLPGIHCEIKHVEKLNIDNAMAQAVRDAKDGQMPTVFHRKNQKKWLVTMRLDDWMKIYKGAHKDG